ncbi:HPr family phosphocarrier protein [Demequina salsinemoris]|uniref:HPr family phosphocarrier protein n=1 Tax=Demequina salsinemoris TaxID=577470 RepID=UPI00078507C6|nr:HPr family phosphocarrier protein [Demequina salsinemoris]
MPQRTTTVFNKTGLHARPAATFAKMAGASGHAITIAKDGAAPIDASSILGLMGAGLSCGDAVTLTGDEGSESILDELVTMLESDLDAVSA